MSYYKLKDLISTEMVSVNRSHTCEHCKERLTLKGNPTALKFFSKKTVYLHYKCKELFLNTLK